MGAHTLKPLITVEQLGTYETAVRYQMYHALALLFLAAFAERWEQKLVRYAFHFVVSGILLFSGSLYLLSLHTLFGIENYKWLGPITPFGGLCFIIGWIFIFMSALKSSTH